MMGGAMREGGNTTPSAEFNMFVDPEAAQLVLNCGRPVTIASLDVTHQALATPERIGAFRKMNSPASTATAGMLEFFSRYDSRKYGSQGAPLHDPCTIAYLLEPDLFKTRHCNVEVETCSELTLGHTAVDFWSVTDRQKNAKWLYHMDTDGFFELLNQRLARYG